MERKDFFESPEGQLHLLRKRRLKRLFFNWPLEPKGHGKIKKDKKAFLDRFVCEMADQRRQYYTSNLALSLDFEVTSNTPPSIEKIPKGYIDLLHRRFHETNPSLLNKSERLRLLMEDDTQIKFLSVNYFVSDDKPRIRLKVDRLQHVIDDLELLKDAAPDYWDSPQEDTIEYDPDFNPDDYSTILGEKALAAMRYTQESCRQSSVLGVIDCGFWMIETLLSGYEQQEGPINEFKRDIYRIQRKQILSFPSCIKLGPPPLAKGESDIFRQVVAKAVNDCVSKYGLQGPVLHPVGCTIIVVQPDETKYGGSLKDIDNYAFHFILPIVHDELSPHTTLGNIYSSHCPTAGSDNGELRLQKGLPHSAVQYTIVEIPRLDTDPEEGAVFMFIGKAGFRDCFWDELDRKIDSYVDL